MTACRSCGSAIVWAETVDARIPLDPEPLDLVATGLVAFNPATGRARVIATADVAAAVRWRESGATIHRSHWATCPSAAEHRVHPAQEALL